MATSSSVILLIVAGSFLGAAYGGDKLHVPPAQDISSFTFQLRTIYGNTSMSNISLHNGEIGDEEELEIVQLPDPDGRLHIYALPVGQGDCTVIQCPLADSVGRSVITIIDAGSSSDRIGFNEEEVVHFLRLHEETVKIKSIFLTHPDLDHIKYIDAILDAYGRNVSVYHSCAWGMYRGRRRGNVYSSYAREIRVPYCCGQDCNHLVPLCEVSDVTLKVIGSEYNNNNCTNNKNGDSIVSIITYGEVKTLIAGDFEGDEEFVQNFIDCPGNDLSADIYRLSHHGARNNLANQDNFLEEIDPSYVFSSSGLNGYYGHPRCSLYYYFNPILDIEVLPHPYTCYHARYHIDNIDGVTAPIYVTTVRQQERTANFVIHFSITENGVIISEAWPT